MAPPAPAGPQWPPSPPLRSTQRREPPTPGAPKCSPKPGAPRCSPIALNPVQPLPPLPEPLAIGQDPAARNLPALWSARRALSPRPAAHQSPTTPPRLLPDRWRSADRPSGRTRPNCYGVPPESGPPHGSVARSPDRCRPGPNPARMWIRIPKTVPDPPPRPPRPPADPPRRAPQQEPRRKAGGSLSAEEQNEQAQNLTSDFSRSSTEASGL